MKNDSYQNPWDDGVYGTGRTTPPKNNGGALAVLLVLVIFLTGIVTILGILNIRMFHRLQAQEEERAAITFEEQATEPTAPPETTAPVTAAAEEAPNIDLQQSPASADNPAEPGGLPLQEIYVRNIPSVVSITASGPQSSASGTGVVLTADGYIVTNNHVVEGATTVGIRLTDDRFFNAQLVGSDSVSDLAVLRVEAEDLTPAQFGDSETLRVGDSVVAIGDPLGVEFRGTMTDGIISAINRDVTTNGRTLNLIQTNAALNSGNSGGPLINCYGQVIGINTMKIGAFTDNAGVEGLGFAIPSATVREIVSQLIGQGYVSGRPLLGVQGEPLSAFYQHFYRMPAGMYITQVSQGSPADVAGVEPGDVLLKIDETQVYDMSSLNTVLYSHQAGDTVTLTIFRGGYQSLLHLTLAEARG